MTGSAPEAPPPIRLVTDHHGPGSDYNHPTLLVSIHGAEPVRCCGESWCAGKCGLPALILPARDGIPELKAYSSMVACGEVMQRWRVQWTGPRLAAPEDVREYLLGRWWF